MKLEDMLSELKKEYVEGLPSKIAQIEANFSASDVTSLKEDFHKLKGTGKTYGIPEISLLGAAVESICIKSPDHAVQAVSEAIHLLKDIHTKRASEEEFNIVADQRFSKIQSLLAA